LHPRPLGVEEVLELVGIREIAARRTHKLSGGQAQRVRFALALVCDSSRRPAVLGSRVVGAAPMLARTRPERTRGPEA
jgi:ABC-type thiamine transport system ATPase subunit